MITLLDTNVVSEIYKPRPNPAVLAFYDSLPENAILISVMTLGEISKGIERLDAGQRRSQLIIWRNTIEENYAERILPVDAEVAEVWGELTARARKQHVDLPVVDGLIAATAIRHGLHVVTRNVDDFKITGTLLFNPWIDKFP